MFGKCHLQLFIQTAKTWLVEMDEGVTKTKICLGEKAWLLLENILLFFCILLFNSPGLLLILQFFLVKKFIVSDLLNVVGCKTQETKNEQTPG